MNGLLFFYSSFCDSQMIGAGRPLGQSAQQSIGQQSTGARLQTTDGRVERPIVVVGRVPCVSTKGWASERGRKEGGREPDRVAQTPTSPLAHPTSTAPAPNLPLHFPSPSLSPIPPSIQQPSKSTFPLGGTHSRPATASPTLPELSARLLDSSRNLTVR